MSDAGERSQVTPEDLARLRAELLREIRVLRAADPFGKALTLAKMLVDTELKSLERHYNRFIALIATGAFVASSLLVFLGVRTYHDIHDQVASIVSSVMPQQVTEQVKRQFGAEHVKEVADTQIRVEAGKEIQHIVAQQTNLLVAAEVKRQEVKIGQKISVRLTHYLSYDQRADLAPVLRALAPQNISILTDTNPDRDRYASDLGRLFQAAGWTVDGSSHQPVPGSTSGVYVAQLYVNPRVRHPFTQDERGKLVSALNKAGLKTTYGGTNQATLKGLVPTLTLKIWEEKQ